MKLTRSPQDRMIGGVCAGVARYYGWDRSTTRLVAVLSFLIPGPNVLVYLALWLLMPLDEG